MLIIGAKGLAKEVLEICYQNNAVDNLVFYDDLNKEVGNLFFDKYPILNSRYQAKQYFEKISNSFAVGIGNPILRKQLVEEFCEIGGLLKSTISSFSLIGNFDVVIGEGANILAGVQISNSVLIGRCSLIYYNAVITHDVIIGDYVEISPGVIILGRARINDNVQIGAGATILPDVTIGSNVIIGAGAVVTKNIPDNCKAIGVPAKIIEN